ncbi:MAG: acyl-CoA dehydrogenase [Pseudomonadota bacterium]
MDFDLNDEQRLLKESVDRLLADRYSFEQRKAYARDSHGYSAALWSQYAELGLLALPFAPDDGGLGAGPVELMLTMEAFGHALVLEPYFATVVLGGGMLRHAGTAEQRASLIPSIAEGTCKLAVGLTERASRYTLHDVSTRAERGPDGWVLEGEKGVVLHGDSADHLIVSARVAGAQRDRDGIALFLIDATAPGVARTGYDTQDGLRAAQVTLAGVKVGPEGALEHAGAAIDVIERVAQEAIAALSAEAVGTMAAMHALTLDYIKTREQFGKPIGANQVVQHAAADMFVALEQARSMMLYATMMAHDDDADERARAMAAAKVQIGRSGKALGETAIQLHGGIGMTMEYAVGHHFKRMTMIDKQFGDSDHHLTALAARGGLFRTDDLEAGR